MVPKALMKAGSAGHHARGDGEHACGLRCIPVGRHVPHGAEYREMHAGHASKTKSCSPRRCCQAVPRCVPRNENHDLIWKSQLAHYK
eukprot:2316778-Pleurochrysis_carterae.AAC.1